MLGRLYQQATNRTKSLCDSYSGDVNIESKVPEPNDMIFYERELSIV